MQVMLTDQDSQTLKNYISGLVQEGIEQGRRDALLEQPILLTDKACYTWLGCSYKKFHQLVVAGMPRKELTDGTFSYSKTEIINWFSNRN